MGFTETRGSRRCLSNAINVSSIVCARPAEGVFPLSSVNRNDMVSPWVHISLGSHTFECCQQFDIQMKYKWRCSIAAHRSVLQTERKHEARRQDTFIGGA